MFIVWKIINELVSPSIVEEVLIRAFVGRLVIILENRPFIDDLSIATIDKIH